MSSRREVYLEPFSQFIGTIGCWPSEGRARKAFSRVQYLCRLDCGSSRQPGVGNHYWQLSLCKLRHYLVGHPCAFYARSSPRIWYGDIPEKKLGGTAIAVAGARAAGLSIDVVNLCALVKRNSKGRPILSPSSKLETRINYIAGSTVYIPGYFGSTASFFSS